MSGTCFILFKGNLEIFRRLTAPVLQDYTRFGHSITNLGDINGDGLDGRLINAWLLYSHCFKSVVLFNTIDVAIGAPFGIGSGKVFVYHGSVADTITQVQQVG